MANWTANEIPDLVGKTVITTGDNSGLRLEAAKVLAGKGAYTILACRNLQKAQSALGEGKRRALSELGHIMNG